VTEAGSDIHQLEPMFEQLERHYGKIPREVLVDGGFVALGAIDTTEAQGCRVYAPPMQPRDAERDPYRILPDDRDAVVRWRRRMGMASAKRKYKDRAATAECVNAQARNRGLWQFLLRGRPRARCVALLQALAQNAMRGLALRRAAAEAMA